MSILKTLTAAAIAASALAAATPAAAVLQTFASFNIAPGFSNNVYFKNSGTNGSNGTTGQFYTTSTGSAVVPGTAPTKFTFAQTSLANYVVSLGNTNGTVAANFTMLVNAGPASQTPIPFNPDFLNDPFTGTGTFSFTNATQITVFGINYAAGTKNLLSASWTGGSVGGFKGQQIGGAGVDTNNGTITFTSDFLDFTGTSGRGISLSLGSINSALQRASAGKALRTFRASSTGTFSSDPLPAVIGSIPEPEVWGLMIAGFGMVGLQMRRRSRQSAISA